MKKFPPLLFSALIFAFKASAQINQTPVCPAFDVSGGESIVQPGELQTFTLKIENYDISKLSFKWMTSGGDIVEGQETISIKVSGNSDESMMATVEIEGLPIGCIKTDTESRSPVCRPTARLFDEFSIPASRIEKAKLDALSGEIETRPNAQIRIIEYFKRGTSQKTINRKIQKTTDYLVNEKGIVNERFTILTADSGFGGNRTRFWIVPTGADAPQP